MAPNTDRCIITDDSVFRKDLIVFDVIYNPEETLLLKKAKAAGCAVSNGLNMLLYQGAASFRLWTGQKCRLISSGRNISAGKKVCSLSAGRKSVDKPAADVYYSL